MHVPASVVLGELARQLLVQRPQMPDSVMNIYARASSGPLSFETVKDVLLSACDGLSRTFLILDALDEYGEQTQRRLLLNFLRQIDKRSNVRIIITSRYHPSDIQNALDEALQLKVEAHASDLGLFLTETINNDVMSEEIPERLKEKIVRSIIGGAQGLYDY